MKRKDVHSKTIYQGWKRYFSTLKSKLYFYLSCFQFFENVAWVYSVEAWKGMSKTNGTFWNIFSDKSYKSWQVDLQLKLMIERKQQLFLKRKKKSKWVLSRDVQEPDNLNKNNGTGRYDFLAQKQKFSPPNFLLETFGLNSRKCR